MRTPGGLLRSAILAVRRLPGGASRMLTTRQEEYTPQDEPLVDALPGISDQQLEAKRNKSGLYPQHRNKLHGILPYGEPKADFHNSLQYKRRMFGRYGFASQIDPGTLWPSSKEIKDRLEYESVAYPKTVLETVSELRLRHRREQEVIDERQRKIADNLKKLQHWKKEVAERAEKRLAQARDAKAKKDALIEEVRRHFGFKIDPKDERFKEMLLQKERDQKKKLKEQRSKAKQEKLMANLMKSDES